MRRPPYKEIRLIPYVCGAGASTAGSEAGPVQLKAQGLENDLQVNAPVRWHADPAALYESQKDFYAHLPPLGSEERRAHVLDHCRKVADMVEAAVKDGAFPVTLGGDHSMAAGTVAGFARAKGAAGRVGLIWIDAHPDINTPESSKSHAYHGMPIAALLGMGDKDFAHIGGPQAVLEPENIVFIGLRDIDPPEESLIRQMGIKTYIMKDIPEGAGYVTGVMKKAVAALKKRVDYLVVSIDLDAFDPRYAPSVGTPVTDGFNKQEVLDALRYLALARPPDMVEVVEYNPNLGGATQTYEVLRDVLNTILKT